MRRGTRDYALGTIGIALVLIFALFPVRLDHLRLAEDPGIGRRRPLHPRPLDARQLQGPVRRRIHNSPFLHPLINSIAIALISTVIAIALAAFAAYAIARLEFPGKTAILTGALALAIFPQISTVGPLFDMWRAIGLYDTYPGLIIPYLTFSLPLAIYVLVAFFREIPVGPRAGGRGGRRDATPGISQGDPPARRAGNVHGRDPGVHLLLERLPVRDHAHLVGHLSHRARRRSRSSPASRSSPRRPATSPRRR